MIWIWNFLFILDEWKYSDGSVWWIIFDGLIRKKEITVGYIIRNFKEKMIKVGVFKIDNRSILVVEAVVFRNGV